MILFSVTYWSTFILASSTALCILKNQFCLFCFPQYSDLKISKRRKPRRNNELCPYIFCTCQRHNTRCIFYYDHVPASERLLRQSCFHFDFFMYGNIITFCIPFYMFRIVIVFWLCSEMRMILQIRKVAEYKNKSLSEIGWSYVILSGYSWQTFKWLWLKVFENTFTC